MKRKAFLVAVMAIMSVAGLSSCMHSTLGVACELPSKKNAKYFLWAGLTPLGRPWPGVTERKTKVYIRLSPTNDGGRDVFKYTRYIKIDGLNVDGGMRGKTFWVKVWDEVSPSKQWIVEFKEEADGQYSVTREEGTFVR